jgi:predicted DsbA family dithiol-disulfide isomerase/uncharacterized membrane protein
MSLRVRETLLRVAALAGLGVSALLIAQHRLPLPFLCAPGGGCDVVRQSQYSELFGIPLPFLGAFYFAAIMVIASAPGLRRWLGAASLAGAAAGVILLGIQAFVLDAFCHLCVVVDLAALVVGAYGWSLRNVAVEPPRLLATAAQLGAALVVSAGAMAWHTNLAARIGMSVGEMPAVVQSEQVPNHVTVVEFVDFECPACRAQHAEFKTVLGRYEGKVKVVLKNVPLPQHQHAIDAARAFCCAEESGAAPAMADKLFGAEKLTPADCEEIAVSLGLNRDEFRACVASKRVEDRLRADQTAAAAVGLKGLPTFWIGRERFEGVHKSDVLGSSIERALQQETRS